MGNWNKWTPTIYRHEKRLEFRFIGLMDSKTKEKFTNMWFISYPSHYELKFKS